MTAPASRVSVVLSFAATATIWGSTYFAILIALEAFPPFIMVGLRFLAAGALLYGVTRLRGEPRPTARAWREAAIVGVLLCTLGNGLVVVAERSVSSGLCAVVVATVPLWAAAIDAALGRLPTRREWGALGLGLAGVVVLNLGSDLGASGAAGVVAILLAPAAWAVGSIRAQRVSSGTTSSATKVGMQMLAGGAAALVVSLFAGEEWPAHVGVEPLLALVYLVVFGSIIGYTAYYHLLRHTSAPVAMSYAYINPIVALGLGAVFAGEAITKGAVVATVLVLLAVAALGTRTRKPVDREPEPIARTRSSASPTRGSATDPSLL